MSDLLEAVLEAHGGLPRWTELETVSARLVQGGALWALKGQQGVLDDVFVTASLHEERVSHHPFGAADRRSAFTPERVAIETDNGTLVEELGQPRASFAGHTLETPWTTLQLAYFVGTAMWTYLTQPFTFALPGFETTELDPWQEKGEQWRRLRVVWPSHLATHSTEQTLYFGEDGLIRRHDYNVDHGRQQRRALHLRLHAGGRHHDPRQAQDLSVSARRSGARRTAHRLDRCERGHVRVTTAFRVESV